MRDKTRRFASRCVHCRRACCLTRVPAPCPPYGPACTQPKQPVEFDQAISYVNKIKRRFAVRLHPSSPHPVLL